MKQFTLKTYRSTADVNMHSFYILNKGINSGRPHPKPFANSFTFIADNADEMEMFYWITFAAWQAKLFHPYLKGSVIPFVTIMDVGKVINEASKKCIVNPERVSDLLKTFHTLNQLENKYERLRKYTTEAKRATALNFIKSK
ncbi:MAG TPA: hypothetical protein VK806_11425 [Bacteroidia bacterium]|jgi:hypothetical protein|nr:hypothetical protein [Bacteroidia bacterium]